jgi:hypothetical protein
MLSSSQLSKGSRRGSGVGRMTATVRFSIETVFDLPQRNGLLASGTVIEGEIRPGMTLWDEGTGQRVTVLGVEFESPTDRRLGRTTLILERKATSPVVAGRVLTTVA